MRPGNLETGRVFRAPAIGDWRLMRQVRPSGSHTRCRQKDRRFSDVMVDTPLYFNSCHCGYNDRLYQEEELASRLDL